MKRTMLYLSLLAISCSVSAAKYPVLTETFGTLASPQTYGHTGWTGTVTVIDPVNHMAIVMLSNKPHSPVADPQKNPNMFESGQLPIATYGWVVDQVYAALKQ